MLIAALPTRTQLIVLMCSVLIFVQFASIAVWADTLGAGVVRGVVHASNGDPLAGATVTLEGSKRFSGVTDGKGGFTLTNVAPGAYRLLISKPGFESGAQDVAIVTGETVTLAFNLSPSSFNSVLRTVANVTSSAATSINTTPAAVSIISQQTFLDQGQQQVMAVLNETPGVITTYGTFIGGSSGAFPGTPQEVQIRGALPYETASYIDGHPVSVGTDGAFQPLFLNPYLLQSVQIVKGPGALGPDINYAIGGSVNYQTLEPTLKPTASIDLGIDRYGGQLSNYRATGTIANGKLAYAFDYNASGSPGPLDGSQRWMGATGNFINASVNGQPACINPPAGNNCPYGAYAGSNPNVIANYSYQYGLALCCSPQITTYYFNRSELAKLRFNASPATSLTVSFIGAQASYDGEGNYSYEDFNNSFVPPAGYAGSLPAGTLIPYADRSYLPFQNYEQQGLFQAELRTTLANNTFLARYYAGTSINDSVTPYGLNGTYAYSAQAWGGIYLNGSQTPTFFNGQTINVTQPGSGEENLEVDHFRGLSGEFDHPVGDNLYIASFDRNVHGSFGSELFGSALSEYDGITIPSGSGQTLTTFSLRALLQPTPTLGVSLGNYITWSDMHYTPGGGTFQDLTNSNDSPRLAVTWHPSANTSYRFAAGSSIAPPYISLVNVPSTPPEPNSEGAPSYYSQQISNPNLKPETAFGFDIGSDVRLAKAGIVLSGDAYITDLQGQYITETIPDGTFTPTEGTNAGKTAPLYTTETINLGHSRYEGVELAARRVVAQGFGYVVQGALIRAYPYDVSPSVYATAFGPNTTNLAILNNVNFQGSGLGYNGYSFGRVPYATGYGEVSYSARRARFALGATYYGNNNSLGRPAYFVTNASLRYDLSPTVGLYLTAYNLTDTYGSNTYNINGGIPVPLVNGMLGATAAGTVGPPMYRASVHIKLGQ